MSRGPLSLGYRAEGNRAFDLGNGTRMGIGGILSGIYGTSSETTPVHYIIAAGPSGPGPVAEIRVCSFPDPCTIFEGKLSRSCHEVMPELMFGQDGADGAMIWIGLQGFSGQLSENTLNRSRSRSRNIPGAGVLFDRTTLKRIAASQFHLIGSNTQHSQWLACLELPSI